MTPLEVNTAARQRYNAVGDTFWSDPEIYSLMYQACLELTTRGLIIERVFTSTSVASQQEYDWPTNAISIKRVQYDGRKLMPYTFRDDDVLTFLNQAVTSTGIPTNYAVWNNVFYLRPIPASALTIKVWAYCEPQPITVATTLEIPTEFHMALVNFILSEMSAKNKNYAGAQYYQALWQQDLVRAERLARKKSTGDAFKIVKNVDAVFQTTLGNV